MIPTKQYLTQISSLLKVPITNLSVQEDSVPTCSIKNKSVSGIINIVLTILAESKSNLAGRNDLEKLEIRQWLEYGFVYAVHADNAQNALQILTELNGILAPKTYLVGYRETIADVFLYYILLNVMGCLSCHEKEKYINISRWFDNIQQNSSYRQSNKNIDFSTNYLIHLAPARH